MIGRVDPRCAVEPPISAQVHTLDRDRALFVRAERQHATVAHRQLVALGFSRHAIAHLVQRRHLRVIHRGVYASGPARPTREARRMAAVLAVGPGAVLSHRSAAALWRLLADDGRAVEVTVERRLRDRDGIRVRSGKLPDDEVITVDGIRVRTVARTILDLAGLLPWPRLERVIDDAELRRLADSTSLRTLLQRYRAAAALGSSTRSSPTTWPPRSRAVSSKSASSPFSSPTPCRALSSTTTSPRSANATSSGPRLA